MNDAANTHAAGPETHEHSHGDRVAGGLFRAYLNRESRDERFGICRNPFGCRAGSLPWSTNATPGRSHCAACRLRPEDQPARLLSLDDLQRSVKRCPICLWLFGEPHETSKGGGHGLEFTIEHIAGNPRFDHLSTSWCPLCGSYPHMTKELFEQAQTLDSTVRESQLQGLGTAQDSRRGLLAWQVLELVRAAREHISQTVFMKLLRDYTRSSLDHDRAFDEIHNEIARVFSGEAYATKVLMLKVGDARDILVREQYLRRKN